MTTDPDERALCLVCEFPMTRRDTAMGLYVCSDCEARQAVL